MIFVYQYYISTRSIICSPTNSFSSDVISNVSETKEITTSLKLNLEEKPDSHGSPRTSDEEEELVRSKERGLRPETAPAVNFPHKADEEESRRSEHEGKGSFNFVKSLSWIEETI